jgi:hypothetical protein
MINKLTKRISDFFKTQSSPSTPTQNSTNDQLATARASSLFMPEKSNSKAARNGETASNPPDTGLFTSARSHSDRNNQPAQQTFTEQLTNLVSTASHDLEIDGSPNHSFSSRFSSLFDTMTRNSDRSAQPAEKLLSSGMSKAKTEMENDVLNLLPPSSKNLENYDYSNFQLLPSKSNADAEVSIPHPKNTFVECLRDISFHKYHVDKLIKLILASTTLNKLKFAIEYNKLSQKQQIIFVNWLNNSLDHYGCNQAISRKDNALHERLTKIKLQIEPRNYKQILNKIVLIDTETYQVNHVLKSYAPINPDLYKVEVTKLTDSGNNRQETKRLYVLYYRNEQTNQEKLIAVGKPYLTNHILSDLGAGKETKSLLRDNGSELVTQGRVFSQAHEQYNYVLLDVAASNQTFAELSPSEKKLVNFPIICDIRYDPKQNSYKLKTLQCRVPGDTLYHFRQPQKKYSLHPILLYSGLIQWCQEVSNEQIEAIAKSMSEILRQKNIIHDDITCNNIMLNRPKENESDLAYQPQNSTEFNQKFIFTLIDFGNARICEDSEQHDKQYQVIYGALLEFVINARSWLSFNSSPLIYNYENI